MHIGFAVVFYVCAVVSLMFVVGDFEESQMTYCSMTVQSWGLNVTNQKHVHALSMVVLTSSPRKKQMGSFIWFHLMRIFVSPNLQL